MSEPNLSIPNAAVVENWCRAAIAGDQDALTRLLGAYHARLFSFARRKIGVDWNGKIDAEDVLQDAYIEVFATIGGFEYRGEDCFYHWVTRIIDHRFMDQVRRWRRKKRDAAREYSGQGTAHLELLDRVLTAAGSPSLSIKREDAVGALMLCLAKLPEDARTVVQRWCLNQEPLAQVAAELGRSEDAVRRLAGRAIEQIGRCMGRASHYISSF